MMLTHTMIGRAGEIADAIREESNIMIVGHADADGITATGIIASALEREGIAYGVKIIKQLDEDALSEIREANYPLTAFVDLGSGVIDELDFKRVVMDHHSPGGSDQKLHLNPHLFGHDGSTELSGAGSAYLVAKALSNRNSDLSSLAIVGAVGDMQTKSMGKLISLNREILQDAIKAEKISLIGDIELFGRETKPIHKMLEYASDPIIPGITSNEAAAIAFLNSVGIELKNDRWRRWVDLNFEERGRVVSALVKYLIKGGYGKRARRLVGEVYIMVEEEKGTELHDAKEFSTLLNATARYDMGEVGLKVAMGDRGDYLQKARSLLSGHRLQLAIGFDVLREIGFVNGKMVKYVHAGNAVRDTLLGTLLNMMLTSGEVERDKPLLGFAESDDGKIKVSSRGTKELVDRGLHLNEVMSAAAQKVGGIGGGHDIAAGATIDVGKEEKFLEVAEEIIDGQYGRAI